MEKIPPLKGGVLYLVEWLHLRLINGGGGERAFGCF